MKTVYSADKKIESLRELLPWYINDTLSEGDKKQLEVALQEHDFLREELAQERALAELLSKDKDTDEDIQQQVQHTQKDRLDALLNKIEFSETALLQESDYQVSSTSEAKKSKQDLTEDNPARTSSHKQKNKNELIQFPKRYLAYAASFLFMLSSALIIYKLSPLDNNVPPELSSNAHYFTASANTDNSLNHEDSAHQATKTNVLLVSFSKFVAHQDISALLFKVNARIIDGPAHDLTYRIEIKGEPTEEQLQTSIDILNQNTNVITFVGRAC